MSGNFTSMPFIPRKSIFSRIVRSQAMWLWMPSIDSPINWQFRASNSSAIRPKVMNSVVQTGVKSAGWLNRIFHFPLKSDGKLIGPWVVLARNAGASSPMRGMAFT